MDKPHTKKEEHYVSDERVVCLAKSEQHTAAGESYHVLACGKRIRAFRLDDLVVHVISDPNHLYSRPTYSCIERKQSTPGLFTWVGMVPLYTTEDLIAVNCPMCKESEHYALVELNETELVE